MLKCRLNLCVIIPTFNNSGTICDVVRRTLQQWRDVIVVVDGSTDGTLEMLKKENFPISIVEISKNRGKGVALKRGFEKARELGFDYALTLDGDGQHFPEDIPALLAKLQAFPESLIVGARQFGQENMPAKNTFANRFSNFWFTLQTGVKLPDTQTGMRIYPLKWMRGWRFLTSRYEAELELLVFAAWAGRRILPVEINVFYPPKSERVSHFRPIYDFVRITILNLFLCVLALVYGLPRRVFFSWFYIFKIIIVSIFVAIPVLGFLRLFPKNWERKLRMHRHFQRCTKWLINRVDFCRFERRGLQFKPKETSSCVYIANHESLLDILMIFAENPRLVVVTRDWVTNHPLFGPIARCLDFCSISQGIDAMLPKLQEYVQNGYSILIFPEGTRTATGELGTFYRGAFYMAQELEIQIQPIFLHTFKVLNKSGLHIYPGTFSLEYAPMISSADRCFGADYRRRTKALEAHFRRRLKASAEAFVVGESAEALATAGALAENGFAVTVLASGADVADDLLETAVAVSRGGARILFLQEVKDFNFSENLLTEIKTSKFSFETSKSAVVVFENSKISGEFVNLFKKENF